MPTFIVESQQEGKRLDLFLSEQSEFSRVRIQKLIKSGDVLVDGKTRKPNRRLQSGEKIFVPESEVRIPPRHVDIPILHMVYEDDDLLVINKPAGLLVHKQNGPMDEPTVVDALLERNPEIADVGDHPIRPGIVHRLDKDVSGLMVIAKTQKAFESLKTQFQNRSIYKEYLALVYGALPKDHDVIELKIARSKQKGRMVARPESQEGREAKTEYEVIKRFKNRTYVRIILHTGRTNQIRVHFLAIDHPIVGDKLYKKTHMKNIKPVELGRLFLHSHKLRIRLMDGKEKTFVEPLPDELKRLLNS
jgi:23S rRNA pseudouridine1911/1915/1917 synthase